MAEIIINDELRHRTITKTKYPICSDCKSKCVVIPDCDIKPVFRLLFAEALAMPEYTHHVFAYCPVCDDLKLYGCGK